MPIVGAFGTGRIWKFYSKNPALDLVTVNWFWIFKAQTNCFVCDLYHKMKIELFSRSMTNQNQFQLVKLYFNSVEQQRRWDYCQNLNNNLLILATQVYGIRNENKK